MLDILDELLAEALRQNPKVIQYPGPTPDQRRGSIRSLLATDSMDGMRFRYWFNNREGKDLDYWRKELDTKMLEKPL